MSDTNFPVFLDLPAPWEAIPYAKQAMRVRNVLAASLIPFYEKIFRKNALRAYAASAHAWSRSSAPSPRLTSTDSPVCHPFLTSILFLT